MDKWTWALLVPVTPRKLTPLVDAAREARYGEDDDGPLWEVKKGRDRYTAIIDRESGSEGSDEDLAVELSRAFDGTIYLLRFRDEAEVVWSYQRGRRVSELRESPEALAKRLGIDVPGLPPLRPVRSVLVVEKASPDAVARAIGLPAIPSGGPLSVITSGSNTIVKSEGGNVAIFAHRIAKELDTRVYVVTVGPSPDRFAVLIVDGNETVGMFARPEAREANSPYAVLDEVKGERSPESIIDVLRIPRSTLEL